MLEADSFLEANHVGENCAVFGVFSPARDVARITFYGLFTMQHRGQESSGIAVANPDWITCHVDMGLVSQVFKERTLRMLKGAAAIGHNRYSTTGSSKLENAQPVVIDDTPGKHIALAHNGNLVNSIELLRELGGNGRAYGGGASTDSYLMARILSDAYKTKPIEDAIMEVFPRFRGAYSLLILTNSELIAVRDPLGIRPLSIGKIGNEYCFASESSAFPLVGATLAREVEPGEVVIVDEGGMRSMRLPMPAERKMCMFEYVYFSRPDSHINGKLVYRIRQQMGRELAREAPVEADLVIGIPDSGTPAAIGYAEESGIPFGEGFVKNRYVGRTFIEPLQVFRDLGVRIKLNPLTEVLEGKRVVLVDDSIVRGSTMRKVVRLLKESARAAEVHVRLSSSPIRYTCHYGVDFGDKRELIAAGHSEEEVADFIAADSLHYLSVDGMVRATGIEKEGFCLACFTDDYPLPFTRQMSIDIPKFALEGAAEHDTGGRPAGLPE
ncbi:MAG: amidophosphoribosyltransferase [bacterium]|jgi:amidophosphoribosyltransferase